MHRRLLPLVAVVAASVLGACASAYEPRTGQEIVDRLVDAGLVDCAESRSPVPDVITCLDPEGEVTVGLTDDGPERALSIGGDGPHLIGGTWVVLTYDGDEDRLAAIRDELGAGVIYVRTDDGDLEPQ